MPHLEGNRIRGGFGASARFLRPVIAPAEDLGSHRDAKNVQNEGIPMKAEELQGARREHCRRETLGGW